VGAVVIQGYCSATVSPCQVSERLHAAVELAPFDGGFTEVVVVWSGETVLLYRGYGLANRELGRPNNPDTLFQIASLSKHFIASLAFVLIGEGVLSAETTVGDIFPDSPPSTGQITVDQLIHHTSGLPSYTKWVGWPLLSREPIATQVFAAELLDQALDLDPGMAFQYSNSGYYVLGALLERASGRSLSRLLQEKLFAPAGMTDSFLMTASPGEDDDRRAIGYERLQDGREFPVSPLVPSRSFAAGAIVSTADDLYRWSRWVQMDGLAPKVSAKLLDSGLGNYGGGLLVARADPGQIERFLDAPFSFDGGTGNCLISWHWGSNPGFNAIMLWMGPETGLVLLENRENLSLERSTHMFELTATLVRELAATEAKPCSWRLSLKQAQRMPSSRPKEPEPAERCRRS
jgi:CubicO group peptidase (beta-lactamase class C family)